MLEIARIKLTDTRNLVLSKNNKSNGIIVGQQLIVSEGMKTTTIFLKGAIYLDDVKNVQELRDALNVVISELNKENK